jgi:parallel beta-helix repeat protein
LRHPYPPIEPVTIPLPESSDTPMTEALPSSPSRLNILLPWLYRGSGVFATLLLGFGLFVANAQASIPNTGTTASVEEDSILLTQANSANVLYVDPSGGNDAGNGSQSAPFKTITQALKAATPNTVIVLAPGTYSAQSGETFPIRLKSGVTIQGDPRSRGKQIVITGGGMFPSPTASTQNIAILTADGAGLTGVTVTNSNPRGYAVWVESSSPLIADNTLTGSTHDGVSVNGNSAPIIRGNHFKENGGNGISVFGSSTPEIRDNVIENTGYGVNISQNGAPTLVGNQIVRNRSGVVIQAKGRPILRNNQIEGNQQDGIVVIAQAQPDLGTASERGGNIIRNNGQLDVNAEATNQMIPAFGNQLVVNRTTGRLDFAGNVEITRPTPVASRVTRPTPVTPSVTPSQPSQPAVNTSSVASSRPPARPREQTADLSALTAGTPYTPVMATQGEIEIPVPPPVSSTSTASSSTGSALPILAPPPSGGAVSPPPADILPVPGPNIPIGDGGAYPSSSPVASAASSLRYRVIVKTSNEKEQGRVKALVPEAFRTLVNGQVVMQAGVFSSRSNASELLEKLEAEGFDVTMQELK